MNTIVIMGSAPCLAQDLAALGDINADFMAINAAGIAASPNISMWATLHHVEFVNGRWDEKRGEAGGNMDFQVVFRVHEPALKLPVVRHRGPLVSGSSTLYGVSAALSFGYENIIIVGAPLSDPSYHMFHPGWMAMRDQIRGRVVSMSGWTREFLEGLNHG